MGAGLSVREDEPYNPLNTELDRTNKKPWKRPAGSGPKQGLPRTRTVLVPISFDPEASAAPPPKPLSPEEAPPGSLLQIWKGKMESGKLQFNCEMLTTEGVQEYYNTPALNEYIQIDGRAKLAEVRQYLEANVKGPRVLVLRGWVTPAHTAEAFDNIDRYVAELERVDKCGVIDIKEMNSHIYLVPWLSKYQHFLSEWRIHPVPVIPGADPLPKLAYFIAFKRRESLGVFRSMNPTLVRKILVPEAETPDPFNSLYFHPLGFPGLTQPEALSDDEDKARDPARRNLGQSEEDKRTKAIMKDLRDKLATCNSEDIQQLLSNLDDDNRELLKQVLTEISQTPEQVLPPEPLPALPASLGVHPAISLEPSPVSAPMPGLHAIPLARPPPPAPPPLQAPMPGPMSVSAPGPVHQPASIRPTALEQFTVPAPSPAKTAAPNPDLLAKRETEPGPRPVPAKQQPTAAHITFAPSEPESVAVPTLEAKLCRCQWRLQGRCQYRVHVCSNVHQEH